MISSPKSGVRPPCTADTWGCRFRQSCGAHQKIGSSGTLLPLPRAAAESTLLGGLSSTTTIKAESTLGSALNRNITQLAGRVSQPTSQPASSQMGARSGSTISVKGTAFRDGTVPAQGSMIASVQAAATSCASARQPASMSGSKAATESAQTNRGGRGSAGRVASQKSKSVITLSFPK